MSSNNFFFSSSKKKSDIFFRYWILVRFSIVNPIGFTIENLTKIQYRKKMSDFFFELEKKKLLELKKIFFYSIDAENCQLSIKTGPSSIGAFCRERPGFEGLNPSKLQLSEFFSGRSSCYLSMFKLVL